LPKAICDGLHHSLPYAPPKVQSCSLLQTKLSERASSANASLT
jgi:hypothetical protein